MGLFGRLRSRAPERGDYLNQLLKGVEVGEQVVEVLLVHVIPHGGH